MNPKHIIMTTVLVLLMCSTASAWLSGYDYRMNIIINNTDGSSLSYQPYNFSMDTAALVSAGKMFANGSDVEITTDADVILKWWNETDFDESSTKIWVNGTSLSNTANTTHHIYYNKSSDVVFDGNISATFDYGEDFEYGSAGYDLIANTDWINVVTPNKFETATISKRGKYSGNQSSSGGDGRMKLDISNYPLASEKFCYEFNWYVSSTSSYQMVDMMEDASTGVTLGMGIISAGVLSHVIGGSWYDITTCPATTWHKMKVVIDPTANTYDLFMNGTQVLTGSGLRSFSPPADMHANVATIFGYTDNIFLREYHDNDIKVYLGSEETLFIPITISAPSPGASDTKYVSNKTVTYSATPSKTADNKWSYENGTFIEWDNSTTTPSMEVWINSSETQYFNISLTAYATGNNSDNASQSWNNPITDNMFDSTNYTWARWDELDLEGWIGSLGNIEVGDVDNDGADEIVVIGSIQGGSYNNRDMIFYDLDGTKTRYDDVTSPNYVFTEASIHDVTEDGINELLCIYAYESPDGISDLYRFNTSGLNGSNLNNDIMTAGSNNPKAISWIDINNDEHYYSCGCGAGETVNCYTTLSSHSATGIDDFGISAEDNIAWDIDDDGQLELLVVEAWAANAARIWMYEINSATGAYTSKTMLFDNSSVGGTHYSATIHTGDIDNDGIDNLIIHWLGGSSFWAESYRIEAYEFDGITNFGEGNFSEGFVVDATSKYCARGHGKTFVADVDNDGLNELVTGGHTAMSVYPYPVTLDYYDITGGGASITKNEIMNCSVAYMGGVSYDVPSITPAFISQGKVIVAVQKDQTSGASLETEIYVLELIGNNIVLSANKYGFLRKNVTASETFSTISNGFAHDICFTWWDDVTDTWLSYWVGDTYNSAQSVPEHESYFVLMDGTGETVSCSIAAAETVAIPIGWSSTYLRESTSKTLSAIKSDMGGNCADLYAWNHTASGTGAWTDTGAYSVLPNQGLLVGASAGFNWDGSVP